jgi:DNA mismatch endonuclease (patch repair protein)
MRAVRGKNTKPELTARKAAHRLGLRFRLHRKDLPGSPDMVLPKYRTVFFVHGCFWHGHLRCRRSKLPNTNISFWEEKIRKNKIRDRKTTAALRRYGWRVVTLWECQLHSNEAATARVARELPKLNAHAETAQTKTSDRKRKRGAT